LPVGPSDDDESVEDSHLNLVSQSTVTHQSSEGPTGNASSLLSFGLYPGLLCRPVDHQRSNTDCPLNEVTVGPSIKMYISIANMSGFKDDLQSDFIHFMAEKPLSQTALDNGKESLLI
jgi:hypothetical protein